MKKWNLSSIMAHAWKIYRWAKVSFAEALHRAWESAKAAAINAQTIEAAKIACGILDECKTWAGWKAAGYMVDHGSKCLFQVDILDPARGAGKLYKASFFSAAQVTAL